MKRGYIFLLLSIFLFSCGENKQEGNTTFKRIPIEYRKASSIKLSEFVDSICIVPLETNTENLSFSVVPDATPNSGIIRLNWEKLQLDCPFTNVGN